MAVYLVSFVYPDTQQAFLELVEMTEREQRRVADRLALLADDGVIADLYVGPIQAAPTPFRAFWLDLGMNPYLRAAEAA